MRPFLIFCGTFTVLLVVACGSGADSGPEGTPTVAATPADYAAIRDVDFEALPETEALLQRLGSGRVAWESVFYGDLTGDKREDAVVPISSDGTLGNIAYLTFALRSGQAELVLTRTMDRTTASGLVMDLDEFGALRETVGVYAAEDPFCCPSQLRFTTFRWDGSALQVAGQEKVDQPSKAKQ